MNIGEVRHTFATACTTLPFFHEGYVAEYKAAQVVFDAAMDEVRADALNEAADEYRSGQLTGVFYGRDDYAREWLRARAARQLPQDSHPVSEANDG